MKRFLAIILVLVSVLAIGVPGMAATRYSTTKLMDAYGPNAYLYKTKNANGNYLLDLTGYKNISTKIVSDAGLRWALVEVTIDGRIWTGYMLIDNLDYTLESLSTHMFTKYNLKEGDTGSAVKNMKLCLRKLGYSDVTNSSNFKSVAVAAVKDFQSKNGLTANGIVDMATKKKMLTRAGLW